MDHAQQNTKPLIDMNLTKQKDLLLYLKRTSDDLPDIDAFTLQLIFKNYMKRISGKIHEIKEICKKSDVEEALVMRQDLMSFTRQLQELEQRSSVTSMFSSYLKITQNDDDLFIYKGISQQKQYFLLRKQYDCRMKQLS